MKFREAEETDRENVLDMMKDYYYSEAVQKKIPHSYMEHTFDTAASGSPYVKVGVMEEEGRSVGYGVAEPQYSSGRGGEVLLVEELYLKEEARGGDLGRGFLEWARKEWGEPGTEVRLKLREDNEKAGKARPEEGFGKLLYEVVGKEKKEWKNVKKKA